MDWKNLPVHIYHKHTYITSFLAICRLDLSYALPVLLYALKLIVMLCVVCQSWWWICLWVEGADFPWVASLSLSLSFFPLYFHYSICPSNQRESLSALATPFSTAPSCRVLLLSWCPSLISSSCGLKGSLTSGLLQYTCGQKDFYFWEYVVHPCLFKVFNHAQEFFFNTIPPHSSGLPTTCKYKQQETASVKQTQIQQKKI